MHSSSPSGDVRTFITDLTEVAVPTMPPKSPNTIINIFFASFGPDDSRLVRISIRGGKTKVLLRIYEALKGNIAKFDTFSYREFIVFVRICDF